MGSEHGVDEGFVPARPVPQDAQRHMPCGTGGICYSMVDGGFRIRSCSAAMRPNASGASAVGSVPGFAPIFLKKEIKPFFSFGMVAKTSTSGSSPVLLTACQAPGGVYQTWPARTGTDFGLPS